MAWHIVVRLRVVAYMVMAYIVMACMVMARRGSTLCCCLHGHGVYSYGLCSYGASWFDSVLLPVDTRSHTPDGHVCPCVHADVYARAAVSACP